MLFSNIGIRERIQILYLLVMQQGTRANLCTLATCRLFISFPVSLALCSREIGCGRRGKERRGYGGTLASSMGLVSSSLGNQGHVLRNLYASLHENEITAV